MNYTKIVNAIVRLLVATVFLPILTVIGLIVGVIAFFNIQFRLYKIIWDFIIGKKNHLSLNLNTNNISLDSATNKSKESTKNFEVKATTPKKKKMEYVG